MNIQDMCLNPKLSVIIPVYNAEQYIEECINSVLNQTYNNIEIIIVNDGSTDNSKSIISKYLNNSNIKYFEKENGGQSSARNLGLKNMTGEFISFLDADDTVQSDTYEYAIDKLIKNNDINIVQFPILFNWGSNKEFTLKNKQQIIRGKDIIINWLEEKITFSVCDKIFRKNIFDNLFFKEGFLYEDMLISSNIIPKCKNFFFSEIGLYKYRATVNSTMTKPKSFKRTYGFLYASKCIIDSLKYIDIERNYINNFLIRIINSSEIDGISNFSIDEKKEIKEIFSEVIPNSGLLLKSFIKKEFGYNGSMGLLAFILFIKKLRSIKLTLISNGK